MDALLILGGLLLIIVSVVWLVVLAFGTSLMWGVGALIPPITLIYAVVHWKTARKAVGLFGLGTIPIVVGFTLLASQAPERFETIVGLTWLESREQAKGGRLAIGVHGQLYGRAFNPSVGTLADGVLTLREGSDPFARQQLIIRLGSFQPGALRLDVLPEDANPSAEIEISWARPEQELPETRIIRSGYTLHLNLQPVQPNKLAGDFHLVLPLHLRTSISGNIELLMDELQAHEEQVNPSRKAQTSDEQAVSAEDSPAPTDRRHGFTLQHLLHDPARYSQLLVRAHTERGSMAEGRFIGIDEEGNLAIRHLLQGSGVAIYNLAPDDIVLLELLEP